MYGGLNASEVAFAQRRTSQDIAANTSDVLAGARPATRTTRGGHGLPASAPVHHHRDSRCLTDTRDTL